MKNLLSYSKILTMAFFFTSFIYTNNALSQDWRDSFHKYPSTKEIIAPNGFILKSSHSIDSKTIKETNDFAKIKVVGYLENLDSDRLRFYVSKWSWKKASKGHNPNWIFIKSGGNGGKKWRTKWRDDFVEFPNIQQVHAETHMIKKVPSLYAKDVKIITTSEYINVAGYINSEDGRFYMSDWSWRRLSEEKDPNWVYIYENNPTSSELYSNTSKFEYDAPEYTTSGHSSSDVYSDEQKRIFRLSASALARYASDSFFDNPVVAAAIGETISVIIERREFSFKGIATSPAIVNAFSKELKKKGHGKLANAFDISKTLNYILSE